MEAWLTDQWQRNSPWQLVLRPISWLFALLAAMRRGAYRNGLLKSYSVGVPVVVVGNISVGGTGKTPLVLAIAELLKKQGKCCGIVTRGYRRHPKKSEDRVAHIATTVVAGVGASDEAMLLARRSNVPVYAGVNRVEAALALLRNHPEVDIIVSDDGLQHYALQRDLEICVIDGARRLGNRRLLPAGPLRESEARLQSVDAIVVNGDRNQDATSAEVTRSSLTTPTFDMALANEQLVNLKTGRCLGVKAAIDMFSGLRIQALAGTGNPQRFFSHLAILGLNPISTQPFPDHHEYVASDFSGNSADIILMTEKDAVKCVTFADERLWFMRVDAVLPNEFAEFILKKLSDRKA